MSLLAWGAAALLAAPVSPAASDRPPLTHEQVVAAARPGSAELAAQAELARARHLAAASSGGVADGWSLSISGGPRRTPEANESDLAAEVEIPLLAAGDSRSRFLRSIEEAARLLPSAARAETRAAVAAAYADAWAAQEIESRRTESLKAAEASLVVARARVAAGAEAPFEAELVALERHRAATALTAARAARRATWGALAAISNLPEEPAPLAPPPISAPRDPGSARRRFAASLAADAVAARAALARSTFDLQRSRDESRWSLRSSLAREGREEVAHVGVAYRLPRENERRLARELAESESRAVLRDAELARAAQLSRLESALALQESEPEELTDDSITRARTALTTRLLEGKSRPSELLPLRLQLLAAEEAAIERRAALARAAATLDSLLLEVQP